MQKAKLHKGFTLLELLVVISIIAILVAVGAASYSTAQKKGRDAKRRGDMKAVQSAFEQYYAKNSGYLASCAGMAVDTMSGGLPSDPKPGGTAYAYSCPDTLSYCVCATLENETGNSGAGCDFASVTKTDFCVANLQ